MTTCRLVPSRPSVVAFRRAKARPGQIRSVRRLGNPSPPSSRPVPSRKRRDGAARLVWRPNVLAVLPLSAPHYVVFCVVALLRRANRGAARRGLACATCLFLALRRRWWWVRRRPLCTVGRPSRTPSPWTAPSTFFFFPPLAARPPLSFLPLRPQARLAAAADRKKASSPVARTFEEGSNATCRCHDARSALGWWRHEERQNRQFGGGHQRSGRLLTTLSARPPKPAPRQSTAAKQASAPLLSSLSRPIAVSQYALHRLHSTQRWAAVSIRKAFSRSDERAGGGCRCRPPVPFSSLGIRPRGSSKSCCCMGARAGEPGRGRALESSDVRRQPRNGGVGARCSLPSPESRGVLTTTTGAADASQPAAWGWMRGQHRQRITLRQRGNVRLSRIHLSLSLSLCVPAPLLLPSQGAVALSFRPLCTSATLLCLHSGPHHHTHVWVCASLCAHQQQQGQVQLSSRRTTNMHRQHSPRPATGRGRRIRPNTAAAAAAAAIEATAVSCGDR